jgi:hypothetical protein
VLPEKFIKVAHSRCVVHEALQFENYEPFDTDWTCLLGAEVYAGIISFAIVTAHRWGIGQQRAK